MYIPPLPDSCSALFFDFDGTLAELAPRPDEVQVDALLPETLQHLASALGGALAVVSGRPTAEVDALLYPALLPVAGVHGAERRGPDGFLRRIATPDLSPARRILEALCAEHPDILLELKPGAMALHYRTAEHLEDACLAAMETAALSVQNMTILCGKKVVELKPRKASKGHAVAAFLSEPRFRHRKPWYFGDDVTDEAAFETVLSHGGIAVKVGLGESLAPWRLPDPAAVRAWMHEALHSLQGTPSERMSA